MQLSTPGSEQSEDLYITYSGAQECVGLHKFGSGRVGPPPPTHDKGILDIVVGTFFNFCNATADF